MLGDRTVQIVKNMTFAEIWAELASRALVGFGAGAILERYTPNIINRLAIPAFVVGMVLFLVASKGYFRKASHQ